jgi:hypothetical protein
MVEQPLLPILDVPSAALLLRSSTNRKVVTMLSTRRCMQ